MASSSDQWRGIFQGVNPALSQEMTEETQEKKDMQGKLESSAKIGSFMRGLLARYERLRGAKPGEEGEKFWDLVVISAGDTSQQAWYEAQLELKHQSGDLPLVPYHIIPDPPGPRIGSGGSTLHILSRLEEKYGARLEDWRILLIHAGGYSKRLP